jgi:hypothetical protein
MWKIGGFGEVFDVAAPARNEVRGVEDSTPPQQPSPLAFIRLDKVRRSRNHRSTTV